jgi:hypothetical protein
MSTRTCRISLEERYNLVHTLEQFQERAKKTITNCDGTEQITVDRRIPNHAQTVSVTHLWECENGFGSFAPVFEAECSQQILVVGDLQYFNSKNRRKDVLAELGLLSNSSVVALTQEPKKNYSELERRVFSAYDLSSSVLREIPCDDKGKAVRIESLKKCLLDHIKKDKQKTEKRLQNTARMQEKVESEMQSGFRFATYANFWKIFFDNPLYLDGGKRNKKDNTIPARIIILPMTDYGLNSKIEGNDNLEKYKKYVSFIKGVAFYWDVPARECKI